VSALDVPLDGCAGCALRCPVRVPRGVHAYRAEVGHEAREILEITPEQVQVCRRPIDRDAGFGALALLRSTLAELLTAEHIQSGHAGHRRHGCRNSARL